MISEISHIWPESCAVVIFFYHMNTFSVVSACLIEGIISRSARAGRLKLNKSVVVLALLPPMSITIKGPTLMENLQISGNHMSLVSNSRPPNVLENWIETLISLF